MNLRYACPALLLVLVACGPTDADRANMKEKMDLETARAKIWADNPKDCAKLAAASKAFNQANHDKHARTAAWWDALGSSNRKILVDENMAAWDVQSKALVHGLATCPNEVKASMRGE